MVSVARKSETKLDEVIPFEKQIDDLKKRLTKNNEAKMVIYNVLPRKEYERIFMCNTTKEIWKTLLITHQGNSQVKDNKIDLLVQQYEQFVISEDESIDSAFARFNTIITSLKALDEGYSSKNYVRKFLRALHPKWRAKVMAIEESKDLSFISLMKLIGNLKVHEMIIKKDSEIVKAKVERKSIVLKAKKESSDEECSNFGSEDEEYAMAALAADTGKEDDEKVKNETCLVAHAFQVSCHIKKPNTGREFDNEVQFGEFCNANGITHNFSAPRNPQSNGVVERKNRILEEISRTMLLEQSLSQKFWCNTVDTSTYILNRILIRAILGKTPYELLRGRKPTLDYFRVFGSKCFILNTKDYLTKFDPKSYEGVFLGYSQNSKAYIILNKHTKKIEESLNVTFDETPPPSKTSPLVDDDLDEEEAIRETEKKNLENVVEDETLEIDEIVNIKESRNHPLENVIRNLNQRTLRSQAQNQSNFFCFISTIEPKNVNEALGDESWIVAMQEELNQFIANDVWELVPQPRNMTIIGTKRIMKQTALSISTTEAEYVSAGKACQQALWMKQALIDYDRLDELAYGIPSDGPYQTNLPSIKDIILSIQIDQEGQVRRIRHEEEIDVLEYQVLTREIEPTLKPLEEIIRENIFCLGGNRDHRKPRKDRGTRRGRQSTSSSTFDQPSSSHPNDDDDDGNEEGTSRASTISPIRYVNSLTNQVP
ncbi:retrovirus-related pol polyprotein from transposon TNT 1-94 [Tanacetum coccineum]